MTRPTPLKRLLALAAAGVCAIALAGCGSAAPKKPVAEVVDGATITAPGTALTFGQGATVVSTPQAGLSSPLSITVKSVKVAPAADLARFGVAAMQPPVTPYYVTVDVKNVGTQNLGGTAIPLYLQDAKNVLVNYSPLNGSFAACPSQTLPKPFASGATVSACLVYLLPQGDSATLVSFRPVQTVAGITWSGPIAGQSPAATPSK